MKLSYPVLTCVCVCNSPKRPRQPNRRWRGRRRLHPGVGRSGAEPGLRGSVRSLRQAGRGV